jgi:hypothetical protein
LHDFAKITLDIIKESKVLDAKDLSIIEKNKNELEEAHAKNQHYRTETEMNFSVLNDTKFPLPSSKYWQCIREQVMMYKNLCSNAFDLEIKEGQKELLEAEIKALDNSAIGKAQSKIKHAEIRKTELQILSVKHEAHYRAVEIKHWQKIKDKCAKEMTKEELSDVEVHQPHTFEIRWTKRPTGNNNANLETLQAAKKG